MTTAAGWDGYYRTVAGRQPRTTLQAALAVRPDGVEPGGEPGAEPGAEPGGRRLAAVDLGCGDGTDTLALLAAGYAVVATDGAATFVDHLLPRVAPADRDRLTTVVADFADLELPPCDLLHAGFALFFCPPAGFADLWARVRVALRPGAVLSVHLLGPRDSWAGDPAITCHDRGEVEALLRGLVVLDLTEEELDGWSYAGDKHWHLWHVLARRPGDPDGEPALSSRG